MLQGQAVRMNRLSWKRWDPYRELPKRLGSESCQLNQCQVPVTLDPEFLVRANRPGLVWLCCCHRNRVSVADRRPSTVNGPFQAQVEQAWNRRFASRFEYRALRSRARRRRHWVPVRR